MIKYLYRLDTACSISKNASWRSVVVDSALKLLINAFTLELSEESERLDDADVGLDASSDDVRAVSAVSCQHSFLQELLVSCHLPKPRSIF